MSSTIKISSTMAWTPDINAIVAKLKEVDADLEFIQYWDVHGPSAIERFIVTDRSNPNVTRQKAWNSNLFYSDDHTVDCIKIYWDRRRAYDGTQIAPAVSKSLICPCGIARMDCNYHK